MKHNYVTIFSLAVLLQLCIAASASALTNSRMIDRYRSELQKSTMEYVNVWVQNKPESAYKKPLAQMLRHHSMLLSYGIDINDNILVAHHFEDNGKPVSMQAFASRIFFEKLEKKLGWKPDLAKPLKGKEYRIKARSLRDPLAEDEFELTLP